MSNPSRVVAALATAVLSLVLPACSGGGGGGDIASVNGEKISRSEFDNKLEGMPQAKGTLSQMIMQSLIDQYAAKNKITVSNAEVQKREDDIKSKYPAGQFEQILKSQNLTEADVQRILRQQAILEKAVAPSIHITDAQIKAYLDKNHASLDTPEQVQARHILVADLKTADMIEAKLKAGGDFAALAKQYSTDPSSKDKGGELGLFSRNQMVKQFEAAAFTQKIGVIGPPVKSPFGYHIIEVEAHKPATVATMANSSAKIRDTLTQQQQQQQLPQFMAELRKDANIQIYDDRLKDALPPLPPAPAASAAAPSAAATPAAKK